MRKLNYIFLTTFICFLFLFGFHQFSKTSNAASDVQRIYDHAGVLNDSEKTELEALAEKYYNKNHFNYLVVTTTEKNEYVPSNELVAYDAEGEVEIYSEAFYTYFTETYGSDYQDCIILAIDLSDNRYADISCHTSDGGKPSSRMENDRCTRVIKKISSKLTNGDYCGAMKKYMSTVNRYLQIKAGINPDSIFLKIWFQALISIIIGGVIIGVMVYQSGGKVTTSSRTYLDEKTSKLLARRDRYIRTDVTKVRRETNSSSGGGGGGSSHSSGGSGSHGGGHF